MEPCVGEGEEGWYLVMLKSKAGEVSEASRFHSEVEAGCYRRELSRLLLGVDE
jgi:hypothetical protein